MNKKVQTMKALVCAFAVSACLVFSGCTKTEKTVGGAAIGAGLGIGIGAAAGGPAGAVAGGLVGGTAGGLIGNSMGDDKK